MNTQDPKSAILMTFLEHQENQPHMLALDARAVSDRIGVNPVYAPVWLEDMRIGGLVESLIVPGEDPGWSGRYRLTTAGVAMARQRKQEYDF